MVKFTLHDFVRPDMSDEAKQAFMECLKKSRADQNELLKKAKEMEENEAED